MPPRGGGAAGPEGARRGWGGGSVRVWGGRFPCVSLGLMIHRQWDSFIAYYCCILAVPLGLNTALSQSGNLTSMHLAGHLEDETKAK